MIAVIKWLSNVTFPPKIGFYPNVTCLIYVVLILYPLSYINTIDSFCCSEFFFLLYWLMLCLFSIYYIHFWGSFWFYFFFRGAKNESDKGNLGTLVFVAHHLSLTTLNAVSETTTNHPPTHTHSHGRDKWVQLTDTHLMSGRLDLGWLMRECLTDSIG